MAPRPRFFLALLGVLITALTLTACGSGVSGNAIATVGDASVSKASFDHWLIVANSSSSASAPGAPKTPVPDAPNFTQCIAYHQRTDPKPPKGQPTPTTAQLKSQCQQTYSSLRDQVAQFLISADWLQGEAIDQGVKVTPAEVNTQLQQIKTQQGARFNQLLASSGMTIQDLLFRVRLSALSNKIRMKVTAGKSTVTPAAIAAYYNQNKTRFAQPERRDLRLVLLKTLGAANHVKALLTAGKSFSSVAKQFSVDQASKAQGGALLGVVRGQQEKAFDSAIFSAPKGHLIGPVKTQFGYYVFRVQKITPSSQQTLAQATPTIQQLLASQGQQTALNNFVKHFDSKWKSRTKCRSGFIVQSCSNAPKQATPPVGAAPQPGQ